MEALGYCWPPGAVDLSTLFCAGVRFKRFAEFTLTGNQLAADVHHWTWNTKGGGEGGERGERRREET